jgi:hypothetical protein
MQAQVEGAEHWVCRHTLLQQIEAPLLCCPTLPVVVLTTQPRERGCNVGEFVDYAALVPVVAEPDEAWEAKLHIGRWDLSVPDRCNLARVDRHARHRDLMA